MRTFQVGDLITIRRYGETSMGEVIQRIYTSEATLTGGYPVKYLMHCHNWELTGWYIETQLYQAPI